MPGELLYFNGINGESGSYDLPPMAGEELAGFIRGEKPPENLDELRFRYQQATAKTLGVMEGVDPLRLEDAGWGVIFAADADPAVQEALQELFDLRRQQAGAFFKLYGGSKGYRLGESKTDFLARHGAGPGPVNPNFVPYYLLIVGSPDQIPYQFQSELDVQYAVGRICFETLAEYASYARSVCVCERGEVRLARRAAFFSVTNEGDGATHLSTSALVNPLQSTFQASLPDWEVAMFAGEQASKAQLGRLLGGDQTPALLFSGSHGMSFPKDSPRQLPHQGALLCQDWPGPDAWRGRGPIPQDFYFAGDDLSPEAGLLGSVAFFFACYGAGTPLNDEFSKQAFKQRSAIAPQAFMARLPMKMLSHPRGGALAVVGHVERAWSYSFQWQKAGAQTAVFESSLRRLFKGYPVGLAIEYFNERYAELSTVLSNELEEIEFGKRGDPFELSGYWTANNDARGYSIVGDPAVRIPLAPVSGSPAAEIIRPALALTTSVASGRAETTSAIEEEEPGEAGTRPGAAPSELSSAPASGAGSSFAVSTAPLATLPGLEYGPLDSLNTARQQLTSSLETFAGHLAKALAGIVDDVSTLNITTYVSQDVAGAVQDPSRLEMRAFTRIKLDGDTEVILPEINDTFDRGLWEFHLSMVQQAQMNRVEMIKAATGAATALLQALKKL